MNDNAQNLCEDWGWYIDLENTKYIYSTQRKFTNGSNKRFNIHYNKLYTIKEDEFDYYINNQKILDDIEYNIEDDIEDDVEENLYHITKIILNIGSATIATAVLTYMYINMKNYI